jgi:hypothetical protein
MDIEQDAPVPVVMWHLDQRAGGKHPHPQLLLELAPQGLLRILPRLQLTARELPAAALMGSVRPAGDQDAPSGVSDGPRRNLDDAHLVALRRTVRSDTRR